MVPSISTAYSFWKNLELVTTFLKAVRKKGKNKRVFDDKEKKNATACRAKTLEVNFQPDSLCDFKIYSRKVHTFHSLKG